MRVLNIVYSLLPFLVSLVLTYFTYVSLPTVWLAYGIWLTMVVGFFIFLDFYRLARITKYYEVKYSSPEKVFRVASFVTSFNEDPEIVKGTLISVKLATKKYGDVYLLDDSTDKRISEELRTFCEKNGIIYLHRENRRGFKAGAINDALRAVGDKYDLVAIFDADQRPVENFFEQVLPYFEDPKVALVQVPQNYSELYSGVSIASKYQQEPFLRVIMRGRSYSSAFSLGSGSVFRISALKEVGYMDESSITEDAATSIKLHEKGYTSVYIDAPLIWYGEPPQDLKAYLGQQSRWSFGYFQLTKKILTSNLSFSQFMDYYSGWLYWLKVGPLTTIEFLAPMVFLILRVPFLTLNPLIYLMTYMPYLIISIIIYVYSMRGEGEYGVKGYFYHQSLQFLEYFTVTLSFVSWILRRKRPFKVTPKGIGRFDLKSIFPSLVVLVLLVLALIKGFLWLANVKNEARYYAIIVNMFWAAYQILFLAVGLWISNKIMKREDYIAEERVINSLS
ncbi:MAG: glycosyltransferase family 2 protein [Sulfolobaceae archaeon]